MSTMSNSAGSPLTREERRTLRRIVDWLTLKHGDKYAGALPRTYLCFDVETTGGSRQNDLIVMVGHCAIEEGEEPFYEDIILDWFSYPDKIVPNDWLERRLNSCRFQMEQRGKFHGVTVEAMRERGRPVEEVLEYSLELFERFRQKNGVYVAHNMLRTDAPWISNAMTEFIGAEWKFYPDEFLDTAALMKAILLGEVPNAADKDAHSFFRRVLAIRSRVKYSLDVCVEKFNLLSSYGLGEEERHTAGYDSLLCHCFLAELQEILEKDS